jgi:hypothetical protein
MDNVSSGAAGAGSIIALGVIYRIYQAINHHKVKSTCMNKEFSASIDIDPTTPPKKDISIKIDESNRAGNNTHPERDITRG